MLSVIENIGPRLPSNTKIFLKILRWRSMSLGMADRVKRWGKNDDCVGKMDAEVQISVDYTIALRDSR